MKKLSKLFYSAIIIAAMGMVSCSNNDENAVEAEEQLYTLSGGMPQPNDIKSVTQKDKDSRMSINTSTLKFKWTSGDVLRIYNASGSYLKSYTIQASDIKTSGYVEFSVLLSETPKYISFSSKGDYDYVDVNYSNANGFAINDNEVSDIPILAQGEISSTGSFALKHKLCYIHYSLRASGTKVLLTDNINIAALGNSEVKIGSITNVESDVVMAGQSTETTGLVKNSSELSVAVPKQKYEAYVMASGLYRTSIMETGNEERPYTYDMLKSGYFYEENWVVFVGTSGVLHK